jgi:glycerate kinase
VPLLLALPDKFRGSATAAEIGAAMAGAAEAAGWECVVLPVSDGGEGLLECFGGPNRTSTVTGPLGEPVDAAWRLDRDVHGNGGRPGGRAVIEMAAASGLALVAGRNDPVAATTRGTGELIEQAFAAGADRILVGVGGSATTDGGLGAVEVLAGRAPLSGVTVAADVATTFVDAAPVFGPQKGADDATVARLAERLRELAEVYRSRFGVAVSALPGSGAAGGLAGGLAALGARIRPGFEVVAEHLRLPDRIAAADLVLTGEGRLDATSLLGKAPVAIVELCRNAGTPVAVVAGDVDLGADALGDVRVLSLTARIGRERALAAPLPEVRTAVAELLVSAAY